MLAGLRNSGNNLCGINHTFHIDSDLTVDGFIGDVAHGSRLGNAGVGTARSVLRTPRAKRTRHVFHGLRGRGVRVNGNRAVA